MASKLYGKFEQINGQLASMLAGAKGALNGESEFGVEQVRALSAPITEMAPVMERASELRKQHPELAEQLDLYKSQLLELQKTLEQLSMMLHARRSQMDAGRKQLNAVSQWASALGQTR